MRFSTLLGCALAGISSTVLAADANAWKTRSIYFVGIPSHYSRCHELTNPQSQVLTDRFAKTTTSSTACSDLSNYCGGTWKGMQNKLDYIQGLGFDSIWITPVVESNSSSSISNLPLSIPTNTA
jgi:alpha-amylase